MPDLANSEVDTSRSRAHRPPMSAGTRTEYSKLGHRKQYGDPLKRADDQRLEIAEVIAPLGTCLLSQTYSTCVSVGFRPATVAVDSPDPAPVLSISPRRVRPLRNRRFPCSTPHATVFPSAAACDQSVTTGTGSRGKQVRRCSCGASTCGVAGERRWLGRVRRTTGFVRRCALSPPGGGVPPVRLRVRPGAVCPRAPWIPARGRLPVVRRIRRQGAKRAHPGAPAVAPRSPATGALLLTAVVVAWLTSALLSSSRSPVSTCDRVPRVASVAAAARWASIPWAPRSRRRSRGCDGGAAVAAVPGMAVRLWVLLLCGTLWSVHTVFRRGGGVVGAVSNARRAPRDTAERPVKRCRRRRQPPRPRTRDPTHAEPPTLRALSHQLIELGNARHFGVTELCARAWG